MNPKVSIILPIYNVEKYLDRCMQSLLGQTLREIEIVMVDDGSSDKCPAMCDRYAAVDSRIKVIHKKNAGLGMARNSGLEIATGEYVAFLDSDDYVDIHTYEILYKTALENETPQAVYCGLNKVKDSGEVYSTHSDYATPTRILGNNNCKRIATEMVARLDKGRGTKYYMSVWHAIYSREFMHAYNIKFCSERDFMSEDLIFDLDFFSVADNVVFIPDKLIYYCENGSSLSRVFQKNRFDRFIVMYHKIQETMQQYHYPEEYKLVAQKYIVGYSRACLYVFFRNVTNKKERLDFINNVINKKELWQNVNKTNVSKIISWPLYIYYILLKLRLKRVIYLYCKFNTKA